ncbi:MAG: Decaprenyl-phosphate phosphoribosyltransferase [Acidobacteriaceae bacterium]|nr:Decaprenyl-phosphate phosphoribosyltransferase [Acidobacteriaceae bacterium]
MHEIEKYADEVNSSDSPRDILPQSSSSVLCVDLDGTILKTDLMWECIISLIKVQPLALLMLPFWLIQGRAVLKRQLAEHGRVDVTTLPYRTDLLAFLATQRDQGRHIALVTASDNSLAERVATHLGLFDEVHGTREGRNLKGEEKAALLQAKFSSAGFDYIGNSSADLPAWKVARTGYVIGNRRFAQRVASIVRVEGVFESEPASILSWFRALRGHHWAKNMLLFLPLLLSHKLELRPLLATAVGFFLFSLCASSIYIMNDLLDLHSDRAHPWKANRPFASGETSVPAGLVISALLVGASIAFGFWLSTAFACVLITYVIATLWYSIQLKCVPLVDVFVLSGFYSIRIWAGSVITSVPLSDWFLAFSFFFFFSLATAKRYSELVHANELVQSGNSGRAYAQGDRELFVHLGVGSSFSAVVILALYVHSKEVLSLYRRPELLLLICPTVLYWLSRLWFRANRGELDEDPVVLSIRDPVSYAVAAVILAVLLFSSYAS